MYPEYKKEEKTTQEKEDTKERTKLRKAVKSKSK
jgi:hypothetical protein